MISEVTNEDNMIMMACYPDKFFDLAIVDPPYGIGIDGQKKSVNKNPKHNRKNHDKKNWDNEIPNEEYFSELMRVSKHQIIFGGNYFTEHLYPVKGWIFWYKWQNDLTMSDGELIWTSFPIVTRQITVNRSHLNTQNTFHPTEKPYLIYKHLLTKYAAEGFRIIDTHMGSQSLRVACHDYGFDFYGCELDPDYFKEGCKRFDNHILQQRLF